MDNDPEMIIRLANSLKDLPSVCKLDPILSCPVGARQQESPEYEHEKGSSEAAQAEGPARPPQQVRQFDVRGCGTNDLSGVEREELFSMFEVSMKEQYLKNWGWSPTEKRNELFHPMSRFLCLYEREEEEGGEANSDTAVEKEAAETAAAGDAPATVFKTASTAPSRKCVAYTMFRFEWDDEEEPEYPVCYCYELQVSPSVQGCGIGTHLMKCLVKMADKLHLWKVLLTCFVSNEGAMKFYKSAEVGFGTDVNSPHKADYEILSDKPTLR